MKREEVDKALQCQEDEVAVVEDAEEDHQDADIQVKNAPQNILYIL